MLDDQTAAVCRIGGFTLPQPAFSSVRETKKNRKPSLSDAYVLMEAASGRGSVFMVRYTASAVWSMWDITMSAADTTSLRRLTRSLIQTGSDSV